MNVNGNDDRKVDRVGDGDSSRRGGRKTAKMNVWPGIAEWSKNAVK